MKFERSVSDLTVKHFLYTPTIPDDIPVGYSETTEFYLEVNGCEGLGRNPDSTTYSWSNTSKNSNHLSANVLKRQAHQLAIV